MPGNISIGYDVFMNEFMEQRIYVGGTWLEGNRTIEVMNPATGKTLGFVPCGGENETNKAISAAQNAFSEWRSLSAGERSSYLRRIGDLLLENITPLAELLVEEQGKVMEEARGEIRYSASFVHWFAEESRRVYGETIPAKHATQRIRVEWEPLGVSAAITPWNFPSAM